MFLIIVERSCCQLLAGSFVQLRVVDPGVVTFCRHFSGTLTIHRKEKSHRKACQGTWDTFAQQTTFDLHLTW